MYSTPHGYPVILRFRIITFTSFASSVLVLFPHNTATPVLAQTPSMEGDTRTHHPLRRQIHQCCYLFKSITSSLLCLFTWYFPHNMLQDIDNKHLLHFLSKKRQPIWTNYHKPLLTDQNFALASLMYFGYSKIPPSLQWRAEKAPVHHGVGAVVQTLLVDLVVCEPKIRKA